MIFAVVRVMQRTLPTLAVAAIALVLQVDLAYAALEEDVKAAILFKVLDYVQWPPTAFADPQAPINIGMIGAPEIGTRLRSMVKDRQISGRNVTVRQLEPGEAIDGMHAVFVGRSESYRLAQLAQRASRQSTLMISETDQGLEQGAVINLVTHEGRIRFEVSLAAAQDSRLEISSHMLTVALRVKAAIK